jgi:hypothetical protein
MRRRPLPTTKVELDDDTDKEMREWAEEVQRSKRRQIAVLLRRLTTLRRTHPEELQRLQLAQ